jgi:lipopolysaccharide/colanic/teichoic acid biosynthesis glycosyltransferase
VDIDYDFEVSIMPLFSRAHESEDADAQTFTFVAQPALLLRSTGRKAILENPSASPWSQSFVKRLFDLSVAVLVLAIFGLPMLAIALFVRLSSPGPAFFVQRRVGRGGQIFQIYKFRTMAIGSALIGPSLTRDGDTRITGLGYWLRKLKLDELPQFYNVLRGEMSLVGPRPKLARYAGIVNMPYCPGITGAATLAFRREEEILSRVHPSQLDPFYDRHIRPLKARMDARYMGRATFWSDMRLIAATVLACLTPTKTFSSLRTAPMRSVGSAHQHIGERKTVQSFEIVKQRAFVSPEL